MGNAKNINYFSVADMDLSKVAGTGSHIFNNDDVTIVLNGRPSDGAFLREGQIYQIPEPRLLLVMAGEADVHLDLEHHHFKKGTVVLTAPDMILELERCSADATVSGIAVKEHIHIAENIATECAAKDFEQLLRMLYLLWDIAFQQPYRRDTVKQMISAMLSNVQYIKQAADDADDDALPSRSQQLFKQFKSLVNQHCEQQRNIPFYAERLRVSPHHLSAVIKKVSTHSVMYWINRAVLLRAKVLLKTSDLMTYEIAERLHFPNSPAFNNFFKRETGLTPKMYREGLQK
ncbi:MAG: AraC family transcriptional regulator [Prevotella sp.]|nr:AraC family transcriptional regulator [Prevotella sp.]